ncbi:hypothetical protein AB6A40_011116 [Gnathostoma spinigerum]|uniref:Uncharacterized protein n=1 Tax=Gnathostoma spinigerum TaxID=75299 RepID=A0ABD6F3L4_9BILA
MAMFGEPCTLAKHSETFIEKYGELSSAAKQSIATNFPHVKRGLDSDFFKNASLFFKEQCETLTKGH